MLLAFREGTPLTARQIAEAEIPDARANQPLHFVADLVKHSADLPVQALLQHDAQPVGTKLLQTRQARSVAVEKNAATQLLGEFRVPKFLERHLVFLLHLVARMGQPLGQITVTREKKQTLGLGIEPADIEEAGKFRRQQVVDRVGGVWIAPARNEAGRLMEQNGQTLLRPNEFVVDFDVIVVGNLRAEIRAKLAVNCNATGGD